MKKIAALLCVALCLFLTGCGNGFARIEYNDNRKIASGDRYASSMTMLSYNNKNCSFEAGKFDGRQTMWSYTAKEEELIEVSVSLNAVEGSAKVVFVDARGNVETLAEFSGENLVGQKSKKVTLTKGTNNFKIVGYDCQDVQLSMSFEF